ncbi:hypothetical protein TNCV_4352511 [Trichonephila clavipes]|nr:hypothetical protein TNCV_4352511 [Trichonephila clavipes]
MVSVHHTPVAQSVARSRHSSRFLGVFSSARTNGKNVGENGVPTFDFVYELKNTPDLLLEILSETGKEWDAQRSITSCFSSSQLTISEMFFMANVIILNFPTSLIKSRWSFGPNTMADWRRFIHEAILDPVKESIEEIGGVGKIVEIDESKFGERK